MTRVSIWAVTAAFVYGACGSDTDGNTKAARDAMTDPADSGCASPPKTNCTPEDLAASEKCLADMGCNMLAMNCADGPCKSRDACIQKCGCGDIGCIEACDLSVECAACSKKASECQARCPLPACLTDAEAMSHGG